MKDSIIELLGKVLPAGTEVVVEIPPRAELGHYSTSVAMRLAKSKEQSAKGKESLEVAKEIAQKVAEAAPQGLFSKIEAVPPGFVNFWVSDEAVKNELANIAKTGPSFGNATVSNGKTIIVEYSQPNIAKKMHVGHLRTTVMGDALANMYDALGYRVIRWNYLGDWGTQFGKLIAAYKKWGNKGEVEKDPIQKLLDLYIKFHEEAKTHSELEDAGREEFKKLEDGDAENRKLWEWFREVSLQEFKRIYELLGVKFDVWIGESFFEPQMKPLVQELLDSHIAKESEGAVVIPLEQFSLSPGMVRKSDGASTYLTRDIANIRYRVSEHHPTKIVYVVGNEQSLHFEQLFRAAELMGLAKGVELMHVKYGLVLAEEGKKFATREGRAVFLEEVIQKAVTLAREVVEQKNKELSGAEKDEVAQTVALGALKYTNLKENRHSDIRFDWKRMLDFSGDSGPYLQYTFARLRSILAKVAVGSGMWTEADPKYLETEDELAVVRKMMEFPDAVKIAAETYATNHLCAYLYELADIANHHYESTPILKDENENRRNARLLLIATVADVLKRGLGLLGIKTLDKI
jgi:arginyl-tRNA synthetase